MKQVSSFHEKGTGAATALRETLHEVGVIAAKLGLGREVRKRAADICAVAKAAPYGQGVPSGVLAAAVLYVACRESKTTMTLKEVAVAGGSNQREVGRCYLNLLRNIHIARPSINGGDYVTRLALGRQVSEEARRMSRDIIFRMSERGFGGRNPMTLAAAAIYVACCSLGENLTQSEVAEAAGVGEESVRDCCKVIRTLGRQVAA